MTFWIGSVPKKGGFEGSHWCIQEGLSAASGEVTVEDLQC